jgi:hypothetical protein
MRTFASGMIQVGGTDASCGIMREQAMNEGRNNLLGLTDEEYAIWPSLHHRVVRGEKLCDSDRLLYDKGMEALDRLDQVMLENSRRRLLLSIEELEATRKEHAQLLARQRELENEIRRLEALRRDRHSISKND